MTSSETSALRHSDRTVRSVGDFISALYDTSRGGLVWYRGHANTAWELVPSIARSTSDRSAELTTIKRFKQNAAPYLPQRPLDDWEWIFLMQHHRAPTRLLDWSESPIVALYFALCEPLQDAHDAAIWCLDPIALNKLAGHIRGFDLDILAFGIDKSLDDYLPDHVNERLSKLNPIAAIGPRNSARMVAQSGAFTVMHAEPLPIESLANRQHIWRILVPADAKLRLREELKIMGISEHSLFPDLDRVAGVVKGLVS